MPFFGYSRFDSGEGLCGWNCRHSFGPGTVGHNPYKDFDAEENKKAYDLSQKQRGMESAIRQTKSKLIGQQTAIDNCSDPEAKAALQVEYDKTALKLKQQNEAYNRFCKDNSLRRYDDRLQIARLNRSEVSKATRAAIKREKSLKYVQNDVKIKQESDLPKQIEEPDTTLPYTIDVNLDIIKGVVPAGATLTDVYTMAGAGTSTPIRDLKRLYESYPTFGDVSEWKKMSGTVYSQYHHYVVHWYQNGNSVPEAEMKLKGAK